MLLSCIFIYRFICTRVFKCILNYVLIQQNVKQSFLDSFLDLHFKILTFTLEKCLFSAFLNVFHTYCLKNEKYLVNYRKIIKLQNHFFIIFLCVEYEKNKFAMFSITLYAFYDLMCYMWLKICYKSHAN